MKVNNRVRQYYTTARERYVRLADEVRSTFKVAVEAEDWFFRDRVKALESYALKIETGRFPSPDTLEDFYACTVVVHRASQVSAATDLVDLHFDIKSRRPPSEERTHMTPSSFEFDDLRLYAARREHPGGLGDDLTGIVFEIQIKTVLQHAWSLATHDLIYKTDSVSWPKERIAYQVKAMLEHAEITIANAEELSRSIVKSDESTAKIMQIIAQAETIWDQDVLPENRRRFAQTMLDVLGAFGVAVEDFESLVKREIERFGTMPVDLSPYALVIQALANYETVGFETKLRRRRERDIKVLIHQDMDLPPWMWKDHTRIIKIEQGTTRT